EYVRSHETQGIRMDVPAIMMKYKMSPDDALNILLEAKQPATVPEPAPVMQEIAPAPAVEEKVKPEPELDWSELDEDHAPVQAVVRPDFLSTASKIIGWGGHVMYCAEGKKFGMPSKWQEMATRDLAQVTEWAEEDPHRNCIAVGKPDGMVWFDDDSDFIARYEAQYGRVNAPRVKSVSGGTHLGFKQSELSRQIGNISKSDGNGGEAWSLRSENKYVIAFGSTAHPNNDENAPLAQYVLLEDCDAPEIPETFIQALHLDRQDQPAPAAVQVKTDSANFVDDTPPWVKAIKAKDGDFDAVQAATPDVSEGGRNKTLASVLGKLHQINWTNENVLEVVSASEKRSHSGRCWSGPVIHQNPLARTQYELYISF
ncbi:MAG TPA: bifunctional DNA primase/polymerase, partial [Candidatus Acidoferrum sp.]|nr:bifunctional DNA primase/polymerase [Candidatus Acidoferrum sp.]